MKPIKDLDTALKMYEEAAIKFEEILETGNYVELEKYLDMGGNAEAFLKTKKGSPTIENMRRFLAHPSLCLRAFAAGLLLGVCEAEALNTLESIAQGTGFASIHAEQVINRWKKSTNRHIDNSIPDIQNLDMALAHYEKAAIKEGKAMVGLQYDEIAEKYRAIQRQARDFIKKEKAWDKLRPFLTHPNDQVRVRIACDIIHVYKKEAMKVLEDILKVRHNPKEKALIRGEMVLMARQTLDKYKNLS